MNSIVDDPRWERLVKVWKEEGLQTRVLAERFGINKRLIDIHLFDQFGTVSAKTYHLVKSISPVIGE